MQECASLGMPMRCSEFSIEKDGQFLRYRCRMQPWCSMFSKADQSESQAVFQQQRIGTVFMLNGSALGLLHPITIYCRHCKGGVSPTKSN